MTNTKKKIDLKEGHNKAYGLRPDMMRVSAFKVDDLSPRPNQPRKKFEKEKIQELAESIKKHGLIHPIVVLMDQETRKYFIVVGERRWRAHKLLGEKEIEGTLLRKGADADEIAMIENVQREQLTPLEEALGYKNLMETRSYTQEQVGAIVGKKKSTISEVISIVSLPDDILEELVDYPHVTKSNLILIAQEKDKTKQRSLWNRARSGLLTVQDTRQIKKGKKATSDLSPSERVVRSMSSAVSKLEKLDAIDTLSVTELKNLQRRINKALKEKSQ